MEYKKFALFLMAAAAILISVPSCNKDDDDDSETFSGDLEITSLPTYVQAGVSYELSSWGAYRDDDGDIGVYFYDSINSDRDTVVFEGETGDWVYTFVCPDTLTTVTVYCYVYADGYSTTSAYTQAVIVDPAYGRTIAGSGVPGTSSWITDSRDSKRYYYTTIGNLDWFRHNLAYAESGMPFYESVAMENIFGLYYTYDEAIDACPDGWRLPTCDDWLDLAEALGVEDATAYDTFYGISGELMVDAYFNTDTRIWEYWPAVPVTNNTEFSALATGYATVGSREYSWYGALEYAAFWAADSDGDYVYYRYFYDELPDIHLGRSHKDALAMPVRCVRDSQ